MLSHLTALGAVLILNTLCMCKAAGVNVGDWLRWLESFEAESRVDGGVMAEVKVRGLLG